MRRLAALAIGFGALVGVAGQARAQTQPGPAGPEAAETTAPPDSAADVLTTGQGPLFSLRSADLTGPTEVTAGEGIWRTVAVRNITNEYRLTIGLEGTGAEPTWVVPSIEQVVLAPGQMQTVRFSVRPAANATGLHQVGLAATLLEAKSVLLIGQSPTVTAERRAIDFSIDVVGDVVGDAVGAVADPADGEGVAADSSEPIAGAPATDTRRIAAGLIALGVLIGLLWFAPRLVGRTTRLVVARTAAREIAHRPDDPIPSHAQRSATSRAGRARTSFADLARPRAVRSPRAERAAMVDEARRAATSVLAERAARARRRAEAAAAAASDAQTTAAQARDRSLAGYTDARLAGEAARQLAHRVERNDRMWSARTSVESRMHAKQAQREAARAATRAQLAAARDAEVDRHTFAELSRASWLAARTEGARQRMQREPLTRPILDGGAEPLAIEHVIAERPAPPPPRNSVDEVDLRHDPAPAPRSVPPSTRVAGTTPEARRNRRGASGRGRVDIVALDVDVLNRVLEARRARDGFDERSSELAARADLSER